MVADFLEETKAMEGAEGGPDIACFSCAGPVTPANTVQMTNIQRWPVVDGDALAERCVITITILPLYYHSPSFKVV